MAQKKLNNLQAGRGIAALMVVLYHANGGYGFGGRGKLGHIFSFGFAGVDFFFVLSGFIIAYTSYHLIGQRKGLVYFLKKRIIRIFPIYWVYLAFALLGGFLFYHDLHAFDHFWKVFLLWPQHHAIVATSWTLPYELFFYLLFACLILSRWSLVVILPIIVISAYNAIQQNIAMPDFFEEKIWNELCTPFNLEFLLGFIAFKIYHKISKPMIFMLLFAVAATIVLEIMYFRRAGYNEIFPGMRILPFGLLAFAAVSAFAAMDYRDMIKTPAFLVYLGNASYTLYLVHANIFNFLSEQVFKPLHFSENATMISMEFVVAFTLYISFVLYKYIEKPLINRISGMVFHSGVKDS